MLHPLAASDWTQPFSVLDKENAIDASENGSILYLPHLRFKFNEEEQDLLKPEVLGEGVKNVSFNSKTGKVKGVSDQQKILRLSGLMNRFFQTSSQLIEHLLPHYRVEPVIDRSK